MCRCDSNHCGRAPNAKSASAASATGEPVPTPSQLSVSRQGKPRTSGIFAQPDRRAVRNVNALRAQRHREALDRRDPARATRDARRSTSRPRASARSRSAATVARTMGTRAASGQARSCSRAAFVASAQHVLRRERGIARDVHERRVVGVHPHVGAPEPRDDAVPGGQAQALGVTELAVHHDEGDARVGIRRQRAGRWGSVPGAPSTRSPKRSAKRATSPPSSEGKPSTSASQTG